MHASHMQNISSKLKKLLFFTLTAVQFCRQCWENQLGVVFMNFGIGSSIHCRFLMQSPELDSKVCRTSQLRRGRIQLGREIRRSIRNPDRCTHRSSCQWRDTSTGKRPSPNCICWVTELWSRQCLSSSRNTSIFLHRRICPMFGRELCSRRCKPSCPRCIGIPPPSVPRWQQSPK